MHTCYAHMVYDARTTGQTLAVRRGLRNIVEFIRHNAAECNCGEGWVMWIGTDPCRQRQALLRRHVTVIPTTAALSGSLRVVVDGTLLRDRSGDEERQRDGQQRDQRRRRRRRRREAARAVVVAAPLSRHPSFLEKEKKNTKEKSLSPKRWRALCASVDRGGGAAGVVSSSPPKDGGRLREDGETRACVCGNASSTSEKREAVFSLFFWEKVCAV